MLEQMQTEMQRQQESVVRSKSTSIWKLEQEEEIE
jgi:hypothetical protein